MSHSFVRTKIHVYLANKMRYIYIYITKGEKKKLANLEKVMNARMLKVL